MYSILLQIFLRFLATSMEAATESNKVYKTPKAKMNYYWNIPTFQCNSHHIDFTGLAKKYGIIQNQGDSFRGDRITILYDPGNFPALLQNGSEIIPRNGGVPQKGNLTLHLSIFESLVDQLISEDFSGVGIIDFESWRPVFRQNFGALAPYQQVSILIERELHPLWPDSRLKEAAAKRFEFYGRRFMEETLVLGKKLRPKARWGYYAYPYCFNMSPNNMQTECPQEVQDENDRIEWLFRASDNFYPSIYFDLRLTSPQKIQMIQGRVNEARRLAKVASKNPSFILPYFWYKYHDGQTFLTKEDLFNSFSTLSKLKVDGLVIWGSSNDVNTKSKCVELYKYVDNVLGPSLINKRYDYA